MLLIKNIGTLVTCNPRLPGKLGEISDASLVIDGQHIAWCGKARELPPFHIKNTIDAEQCLVTPGFIDCHSHLIFAGSRALEFAKRMRDESYESIMAAGGGIMSTVKHTREASDEELFSLASRRADHILRQGTTTLEVKSGYGLNMADELRILRLIKKLNAEHELDLHATFLGAHVVPSEYQGQAQEYVKLLCGPLLEQIACEKLAVDCDVFCEQGAFTVTEAFEVLKRAHELGLGLRAHVQQLALSGGVTLLEKLPIKSISHADFLSAEDLEIIKKSGAVVEALPFANLFVRSKHRIPVAKLRAEAIPLAIATNFNPGTAMCSDLLLAARLGVTLLGFYVEDALLAITRMAALALGRYDIGEISIGNKADLLITNFNSVNDLFYDWSKKPLKMVVKNGSPNQ